MQPQNEAILAYKRISKAGQIEVSLCSLIVILQFIIPLFLSNSSGRASIFQLLIYAFVTVPTVLVTGLFNIYFAVLWLKKDPQDREFAKNKATDAERSWFKAFWSLWSIVTFIITALILFILIYQFTH